MHRCAVCVKAMNWKHSDDLFHWDDPQRPDKVFIVEVCPYCNGLLQYLREAEIRNEFSSVSLHHYLHIWGGGPECKMMSKIMQGART